MGIPASPRPAVADCVRLYVLNSKEREFGSTVVGAGSNTDGEWDTQKIAAKKAIGRSYLEIERYSFALFGGVFPHTSQAFYSYKRLIIVSTIPGEFFFRGPGRMRLKTSSSFSA